MDLNYEPDGTLIDQMDAALEEAHDGYDGEVGSIRYKGVPTSVRLYESEGFHFGVEVEMDDDYGSRAYVIASPRDTLRDAIDFALQQIEGEAKR